MIAVYIFATVFGLGVLMVDMVMMFTGSAGSDEDGGGAGDDASTGDDGGGDDGVGAEDATVTDAVDAAHASAHHEGSYVSHQRNFRRGGFILRTLGIFRHFIYFCIGFGPIGLFAELTGQPAPLWAVFVGIVTAAIAAFFRRFQSDKLDSSVKDAELLMEQGKVLVSILPGQMGRVRIRFGGMNIDRFARGKNPGDAFKVGDTVQVHEVRKDIVIVEHAV